MRNKVKEFRKKKDLTQFELSKMANITQADISQIETEKIYPYKGWRKRISKALGVDEEYLFPEIKEDD
jgi:transcriptional regulator with XRE-family HTH domain